LRHRSCGPTGQVGTGQGSVRGAGDARVRWSAGFRAGCPPGKVGCGLRAGFVCTVPEGCARRGGQPPRDRHRAVAGQKSGFRSWPLAVERPRNILLLVLPRGSGGYGSSSAPNGSGQGTPNTRFGLSSAFGLLPTEVQVRSCSACVPWPIGHRPGACPRVRVPGRGAPAFYRSCPAGDKTLGPGGNAGGPTGTPTRSRAKAGGSAMPNWRAGRAFNRRGSKGKKKSTTRGLLSGMKARRSWPIRGQVLAPKHAGADFNPGGPRPTKNGRFSTPRATVRCAG